MNKTPKKILILSTIGIILGILGIVGLIDTLSYYPKVIREQRINRFAIELSNCVDSSVKYPSGLLRAKGYIKSLEEINTNDLPLEIKTSLSQYITALKEGIETLKQRKQSEEDDKKISLAKQNLKDSISKAYGQ
jgi:hypothetical protein